MVYPVTLDSLLSYKLNDHVLARVPRLMIRMTHVFPQKTPRNVAWHERHIFLRQDAHEECGLCRHLFNIIRLGDSVHTRVSTQRTRPCSLSRLRLPTLRLWIPALA